MTDTTIPIERGCGRRQRGGLYACTGVSVFGRPMADFLIDPPKPWPYGPFRSPMLLEGKDGVLNVVDWVGEEHYPFAPDFAEEVGRAGVSRRLPRDFPVERLTPGKSRIVLVHAKALPEFPYRLGLWRVRVTDRVAEERGRTCERGLEHIGCVFDLWPLCALEDRGDKHAVRLVPAREHEEGKDYGFWNPWDVKFDRAVIKTPSVAFTVDVPLAPRDVVRALPYQAGIFAAFPLTHLEYIGDAVPKDLTDRAKVPVVAMPE